MKTIIEELEEVADKLQKDYELDCGVLMVIDAEGTAHKTEFGFVPSSKLTIVDAETE